MKGNCEDTINECNIWKNQLKGNYWVTKVTLDIIFVCILNFLGTIAILWSCRKVFLFTLKYFSKCEQGKHLNR